MQTKQNAKNMIIVISGPSGSGKTTIIEALLKRDSKLCTAISVTTRPQRPGEINGKDYYFLSSSDFEKHLNQKEFIEHAVVYGNSYGTLKSEVQRLANQGCDIVFNKDYQGLLNLRQHHTNILSIFIAPPSLEELEKRLRARKQDPEDTIQKRLAEAKKTMEEAQSYGNVIVNDDLNQCIEKVEQIIQKHRKQE